MSFAGLSLLGGYMAGRRRARGAGDGDCPSTGSDAALLKLIVEQVHEGLLMQDIYGRIEWSNPAYSRITGYSAEEIRGRRPQEFILAPENHLSPEAIATFKFDLEEIKTGHDELIRNRRKNGEFFWNQLTFAVVDGKTPEDTRIILICRDVTGQVEHLKEMEEARERLRLQAEHDDLTGVANRSRLSAYLQERIAFLERKPGKTGVIHLDLDHFKEINDSHGHGAGDAVLRHVADVLKTVLDGKGLVARIGGDEFLAVIADPEDRDEMEELATLILDGLKKPVKVHMQMLQVSGSVGLLLEEHGQASASELIHRADLALYAAKRSGRNKMAWYTDALGAAHHQKRLIMGRLEQDLQAGNLSLLMQPQYCLEERRIAGYEVTVHWLHPSQGLVNPVVLLSPQEDAVQIAQIERFALERGLTEIQQLRELSGRPVFMSVNLSAASLKDKALPETLRYRCEEAGLETGEVIIELEEKVIRFDQAGEFRTAVENLSRAGFRIALDAFGSGHGGGGQLVNMRFDMLKISSDLVDGVEGNAIKRQLVLSVIQLAEGLDVEVGAVGVNRSGQIAALRELGCKVIQGGAIAKPLSPREAEIHLNDYVLEADLTSGTDRGAFM